MRVWPLIPISRPTFGAEDEAAVLAVLRSGHVASGPKVQELEAAWANYCGVKRAVATCNGTVSLHATLLALGVGPGDEVITTPFSFVATANAILLSGATPVFVDVTDVDLTLDPARVREAITPKTKAIMPVHLYGMPADMEALSDAASEHGIQVLEDAAQAHGAKVSGRRVGGLCHAASFSLYATKNLVAGEGGLVTTNDSSLAERVASFCNHGRPAAARGAASYEHEGLGSNYRMSDVHAALALVQLRQLESTNERRRANAAYLTRRLKDAVRVPADVAGRESVYHQYTIRIPARDHVRKAVTAAGVGCGVYYPRVLYEYPHLQQYARDCPIAERGAREVLSLPVHPQLSGDDLATIADAVLAAVS